MAACIITTFVFDFRQGQAEKAQNEANLRGHLKGEDEEDDTQEEGGSSSYVPPEKDKDIQLHYGLDLLRGIKSVDTDAKKKTEAN